MKSVIRVSSPSLLGNEKSYVMECLDRAELSWRGRYIGLFEESFADFCGVKYARTVCNGSSALHLGLLALGVQPGDRVFLPALSYVATANAVRYVGATPVFCDIDRVTWCLESADVERRIKEDETSARCILPVHLYGVPASMDELTDLAKAFQLDILEDAAEAHGSTWKGNRTGSLGDIGAFSFFANKLLTTGEGGMITTNDRALAERVELYRGQGQTPGRQFYHEVVGYNYRMTNVQAAIGLAQLETFKQHKRIHQYVANVYLRNLPRASGIEFQRVPTDCESTNWLFTLLVPEGVDRDKVIAKMARAGVETRPVFVPLTELPIYRQPTPPNTAEIAKRGISLPTHGALTDSDIFRVIEEFTKAVR